MSEPAAAPNPGTAHGAQEPALDAREPGSTPAWIPALFASIDARDAGRFVEFLADDGRFRFGNLPPVAGRAAIRTTVADFFSAIAACRHRLHAVWSPPGHAIVQGEVTYTRMDGGVVTVPFVNVLALDGDLVRDYLIYVDATPLFAPA